MRITRRLWKWYKFRGEVITEGKILNFKAYDKHGSIFDIKGLDGIKVISLFPDINTPVCDKTSRQIDAWSKLHKNITFISICTNTIGDINKWCLSTGSNNSVVLSDKELGDFGRKTNLYIPRRDQLGRGFIVLNERNKIISIRINRDMKFKPDYTYVNRLLKSQIK